MQGFLDGREIKAFFDSFSDGVIFTDTDLLIQSMNPVAEYILGIPAAQAIGNTASEICKGRPDLEWVFEEEKQESLRCWEIMQCTREDCPLWGKQFTDCWADQACTLCTTTPSGTSGEVHTEAGRCFRCQIFRSYTLQREGEILGPQKEKILLQARCTAIRNELGDVVGKIRILRDVTQERELARMKDDFLAVLSHELRNPLASIRSYTEILLHYRDTDPETQREFLRIVYSESERLDQMLEDVMELQRLESASLVSNNKEIFLPDIIEEVLQENKQELARKNIACKIELDPQCPKVWADAGKIYQVFSTLLRHLKELTPIGGSLQVRARPMKGQRETDQHTLVKLTLSNKPAPPSADPAETPAPDAAAIPVAGEGVRKKRGLGLAFALCKKILDQYGGNLRMESGDEESIHTLHLLLPTCVALSSDFADEEQEEEARREEKKRKAPPTAKETKARHDKEKKGILIVDDDPSLVNALVFTLTREGYRVHSTTSARRALEMVYEVRPDLIISDITMPEMDGYALFQHIQKDDSTKMIPFIFISAKGEPKDRIQGLKIGVDDYLAKPFEIKELSARVEALLGRVDRLKDLSRFDPLTGSLTRRAFEESLAMELKKAQLNRRPMSLTMADLDYFKNVNDTYGHVVGDFVLASFVRFLQKNLRGEDILARYGGEEFCIVMPNVPKQNAQEVLERIRTMLSETTFHYEKENLHIRITCSFGVSGFPEDSSTGEGLILKSDEALYIAKSLGRNQVVLHGDPDARAGAHVDGQPKH